RRGLPRQGRKLTLAAIGVIAAVVVLITVGMLVNRSNSPTSAAAPGRPLILVEPFEDLSGSATSGIIARGIGEEIVGQLAKFRDLELISGVRASTGVAAAPDTRYALAGSVRIEGDRIRVTASLRDAKTAAVLWAQSFDANLKVHEVLSIEANVAG